MLQYSQKMLNIEKEIFSKISSWQEPFGELSIRIPQSIGTYLLPSVLSKFHTQFPKVGVDISSCIYHSLQHELRTGIADLAFLFADSIPFSELEVELLRVEPLILVSSPDHTLAKQSNIDVRDLIQQSIFLPKHDCSYKMLFEQLLTAENISPITYMEVNSVETIKQCVMRGIGITLIPKMSVEQEIAQKKLTALSWSQEGLETGIIMIWHKDKWLSPTLRALMDIVREVLKSSESDI